MTIKVKNISGLENYATSIQGFAGKFELAANDTVREFNTSLEGEKAEAINAFFQKLNEIQNEVFLEAPKAIRIFGQHISTFAESIKGLGFSNLAYTDDDAMSKLQDSLKTPQRNGITIVKDDLVAILDEAIEAMGEGDSNLVNFDLLADTYISTEIFARTGTHTGIKVADSTLLANVSCSDEAFKSFTDSAQKARIISKNISPVDILNLIASNNINSKNIDYLDLLSTDSDANVAIAAWNDRLEDTTSLPPETIKGGYKIISMELAIGIERNNKNKIEKYFDSLGKVPVKVSKEHISNLKSANDDQAHKLQAAQAGLNGLEYDENSPEIKELNSRLTALSKLNGLLQSVEKLELGTSEYTLYSSMTQYHNSISYDLKITKLDEDDNITFTVTKHQTTAAPEVKYYSSGLARDYSDSTQEQDYKSLTDNRQERAKERMKLMTDLADISTDFIPGGKLTKISVSSFKTLLSTFDSFDFKEMGKGISEGLPETISIRGRNVSLKTFAKAAGGYINSAKKYNENLSKLDKDELKLRSDIVRGFTNKGAWVIKQERIPKYDFFKGEIPANNVDTLDVDSTYYYDYDAYIREQYLDKEGVSQYLNSEDYNKYFDRIKDNTDSTIIDYLKGNSKQKISEMNSDQLEQVKNALNNLPGKNGYKEFKDNFLWNNKFRKAQ